MIGKGPTQLKSEQRPATLFKRKVVTRDNNILGLSG